jgi:hypothetical protein
MNKKKTNSRNNVQRSQLPPRKCNGKKYDSKNLLLIYPECETFNRELHFQNENQLKLRCVLWSFIKKNYILENIDKKIMTANYEIT